MYGISFDPDSNVSKYQQLVNQLRDRITDGRLGGGTKMISSRELAASLHVARGIVVEAYEQLKMEGYLKGIHGSGTFVLEDLVWRSFNPAPTVGGTTEDKRDPETEKKPESILSFIPGMPNMDLFPRRQWMTCYQNSVEYADIKDLEYAPSQGRLDLRAAIVKHLSEIKGIKADMDSVFITAGSSQAFSLLTQLFNKPLVAIENPQADFVYRIFKDRGCRLRLIPVDDQGMMEKEISDKKMDLIYVTPTHQFPLGGTLSAERRIALLRKARETEAWVIEDDFDSEFRYQGNPVTPLHVMAPERVIYIGTFSKIVSPSLRIGFMVIPPGLLSEIKHLKSRWDFWNEGLQQKAMAQFINRGFLGRHIAKAHKYYRGKNVFLQNLIREKLSSAWEITGATTGMHLGLKKWDSQGKAEDLTPLISALMKQGILLRSGAYYDRSESGLHKNVLLIAYGKRSEDELEQLIKTISDYEKSLSR